MNQTRVLNVFALGVVAVALSAIAARNLHARAPISLLNVSYDPTREPYARLNPLFVAAYAQASGKHVEVRQAHGGSSRQARSVISGALAADVVTLGLFSGVESLHKRGLIATEWAKRLPNGSQPYYVHLAWESEALREAAESKGALEIVYPPLSILAEPAVAWVDANVAKHNTQSVARA